MVKLVNQLLFRGTNIYNLEKRNNIDSKVPSKEDMLVRPRVLKENGGGSSQLVSGLVHY